MVKVSSKQGQDQGRSSELRVVLLGKTGDGKSASGNTILGSKEFESKISSSSTTRKCEKKTSVVAGRTVSVIDTPGIFNTDLSEDEVKEEIARCISLCSPGPHAFLLVMPVGRYTEHKRETVQEIQKMFSEEVMRFTIILFTRANELKKDKTIEEYLQRGSQELRELVRKCGGYHAFNNKNKEDRTQVTALLEKIESMVAVNGGSHYTDEMYQQAETAIKHEQVSKGISREEAENSNSFIRRLTTVLTGAAVGAGLGILLGGGLACIAVSSKQGQDQGRSSELRVVLLGKTGDGKSASGNTILGSKEFESKISSSSTTRKCEKKTSVVAGRTVSVIDTPGIFNTDLSEDEVKEEIARCISLCSPGPHAFLLVMPVGRYTEHKREIVQEIQKMFSEEVMRFTIILFTRANELKKDKTIEEYLQRGSQELRELVRKCGGYHAFNNKNKEDRTQVTALLEKIESMVALNGGSHYTDEMYQQAETAIKHEQVSKGISREEAENSNSFIRRLTTVLTGAAVGAGLGILLGGGLACIAGGAAVVPGAVTLGVLGGVVGASIGSEASGPGDAVQRVIKAIADIKQEAVDTMKTVAVPEHRKQQ
ncbi:UNVERIFIED_CONTAM: hypothetical protein FKN15_065260 [Acipenser sinensis]